MKKFCKKLRKNITKDGINSTFIGLLMIGVSIHGLFIGDVKFDEESLYIKGMYYCGGIGILLLLVSDNFIKDMLKLLIKFFDHKIKD